MTTTLEQGQADLLKFVGMVQRGEEVLIASQGHPVAKLTGVPQPGRSPDRQAWVAKLARLRESTATGKTGLTVEQMLEEDRGD